MAPSTRALSKTEPSRQSFGDKLRHAVACWFAARIAPSLVLGVLAGGALTAQGQQVTTFSTAGNNTWLCPAGVTSVQVQAWGGGGGSGGAGATDSSTGGGAGGAFVEATVPVSPGTTYNLTVGAGGTAGAGGSVTGTNGGTGGASYFGNTTAGSPASASLDAVGGPGSVANNVVGTSSSNHSTTAGAAAATTGNVPGNATLSYYGASGTNAVPNTNTSGAGGNGAGPSGSSGGGSGGAALTSAGTANSGAAPGGGGGGADQSSSNSHGAGAVGGVGEIVLTYTPTTPTVAATGTLSTLLGYFGTACGPTTFSVSGANLTGNITVACPIGFEISTSVNSGYASSLLLTPTGGSVGSTTVYVRLAASDATGPYSGNVTVSSPGATTQNVAVPTSTVVTVNPFTQGNVVVEQADNGSVQNSTATLVEVNAAATTTQSSPVQSIPLPGLNINASPTLAQALRINGSGGTTGYLATTNDGTELAVVDANALSSGDLNQTTAANILNRAVATFGAAGTNLVFPAYYTGASGNQARAATSLDDNLWFVADKGGIYTTSGASPATGPDSTTNMLAAKSFGAQVYGFSASAPGVTAIAASGGGIGTLSSLPGLSIANGSDFYLISSGVNGAAFDVCYVCSETSATAGSINKYSLVNGSWVGSGSYATNFGGRSMVAMGNAGGATLFLTGGDGSTTGTSVIKVTDTAPWNSAIAVTTANNLVLYTFPSSGPVPKGIAFAPLATVLPDLTIAVSAPASSSSPSFSYTLTLANSGTANATGVTANFTLPSGLSYASAVDNGGNGFTALYSGGVVSISGGTLNANSSDTITVSVDGTAGSTYTVDPGTSPVIGGDGAVVINTTATTSSPIAESNSKNNGSAVPAVTTIAPPAISGSGTPGALTTSYGVPSAPTSFSASATNLVANLTVTAPGGFEVSTSSGSGYAGSLSLTPTDGTVAATTIYVRLAAATNSGSYSGNVSLSSSGAATQYVAIPSSTVQPSANLSGLAVSTGSLTQAFAAGTLSYTEFLPSSATGLTVTPTADAGATVTVNGVAATTPVSLNTGANTITVFVTANGGGSTQTYTITAVRAGPFTLGDLVVTTYGNISIGPAHTDGQTTLITLEEFSPTIAANSSPVMAVVLPSAVAGNNVGIAGEYGSSSEGTLQLSSDGLYLAIGGYSAVPALAYTATPTAQSPAAQVPRVAALIDVNTNTDTSSVFNDIYNTNNPRAVYTPDDVNLYFSGQGAGVGDEGGLYYTQDGTNTTSEGAAPTGIFNVVSTREVQAYEGNLYYSADQNSSSKGTLTGIFEYAGLPTVSQSTDTGTRLTPADNGSGVNYSPEGFYFANATTLYVADTGDPKAGGTGDGGIQKWSFNGTQWVLLYTLTNPNFVSPSLATTAAHGETGFEDLTGQVIDGVAYLYAVSYTAGDADPNGLYGITDPLAATSPSGQTFTEMAAAPGIQASGTNPDFIYKSVSFAPTGAPSNPGSASDITGTGATLNGTINPNGTDTQAYFVYGTTTSYGMTTAQQDIGSGTSPVSFSSLPLTGLQPGTTYYYQLVTVANGLTSTYANQTFTTSGSSPSGAPTDTPAMPPGGLLVLALMLMAIAAFFLKRQAPGGAS